MTAAELADLSGVELRRRLTQRGVPHAEAFRLEQRRDIPAVTRQILAVVNRGREVR